MAVKDTGGLVVLAQNYAVPGFVGGAPGCSIQALTSAMDPAYPGENVMAHYPSRPARFTAASLNMKRITLDLGAAAFSCTCMAIIGARSNVTTFAFGDDALEDALKFQIVASDVAGSGEYQVWPTPGGTPGSAGNFSGLDDTQNERWGFNLFATWNQLTRRYWTVYVKKLNDAANVFAAEVGGILIGRSYTFSHNPRLNYSREALLTSVITSRPGGPSIQNQRDEGARVLRLDQTLDDLNERDELERLVLGRGRRNYQQQLRRKRLDLPTALIGPDMWSSPSATFGGCIYGRMTGGIATTTGVGGISVANLVFEEMN